MTGGDLARTLWDAIESRRWEDVAALLAPELTYTLPQSGEVHDRAGYLRMNREYPGAWRVTVDQIVDGGDWVVTEVSIAFPERTERGVSLMRCAGGRIVEIREYWPEPFPIPEWRLAWTKEDQR